MSDIAVQEAAELSVGPAREPRTFTRRILGATFARWGARIGAAWIGLLVILAVFAPFIANSRPYIMKVGGQWSSPLLRYLDPADVTLVVIFIVAAVVFPIRRISLKKRWVIVAAVALLTLVLSLMFVSAPGAEVYSRYREMEKAGEIDFALYPPIPYSPSDRMRDYDQRGPIGPWWSLAPGEQGRELRLWLGNEANGADVASRMIHAARIALAVGIIATSIAMVIGIVIGGLMGYFSGVVDLVGMRLVEIFEFIPTLFLLLMFVAFFERNIYMMMVIIGLTSWVGYARFIRAEFLKLRRQDFVQAAIATGLPLRSILFRHMLPNGLTPVLVSASFGVASAILAEATLSFLGLGLVDEPSWGQLLNQAVGGGSGTFLWWIAIFPGLAIFLTVFAYNLVGEALRDAIDPHLSKAAQM